MLSRSEQCRNGNVLVWEHWYKCDNCGTEMFEGDPRYSDSGDLCPDCAYLLGVFDTKTYKRYCYHMPDNFKVGKHEGKIYWWNGKKAPWDKKPKDYRSTPMYAEWRASVFKRDNFTCQDCGRVGGKLEGHHIMKFHDYPDLRFVVSNGRTLCRPCHVNVHRGPRV